MAESQTDAVAAHFTVDEGGHIRVEGIHQLLWPLDDGDIHSQFPQILRQFQADEAAAGQHGRLGMILVDILLDAESILHRAQGKQTVDADARQARLGRLCAGREQQLVIGFFEFPACFQVSNGDCLSVRMNGRDFMMYLHVHPETGEETLRSLQSERFRIFDDAADIIR